MKRKHATALHAARRTHTRAHATMSTGETNVFRTPTGCETKASTSEELAYHRKILVDGSMKSVLEQTVRPQNGIHQDVNLFDFHVHPIRASLPNFAQSTLHIQGRLAHLDGSKLTPEEHRLVAPICFFHHTMWKSGELRVNQHLLNLAPSYNIGYKSQLRALLSVDSHHHGYLTGGMWYKDSDGRADVMDDRNAGFLLRSYLASGESFSLSAPVPMDFFDTELLFGPGNTVSIRLTKHADAFYINTSDPNLRVKFILEDMYMVIPRIELYAEALPKYFNPKLPQHYEFSSGHLHSFSLPTHLTQKTLTLVKGDILPKQVIVAAVKTKAYIGDYGLNPFVFEHFDCNRINLVANSSRIPSLPYTPDFSPDRTMATREFNALDKNTGKYRNNLAHAISYIGFVTDHTIFAWDLTPDQCNSYHRHAGKEGVLELEMGWAKGLTEPITILALLKYDQVVTVDPLVEGGDVHEQLY